MQVEVQVEVQFGVQGEAPSPLPPILPISLKAGLIGIYRRLGERVRQDPQTGNSFGSCVSVNPRLGFFLSFVLRAPAVPLPSQCNSNAK